MSTRVFGSWTADPSRTPLVELDYASRNPEVSVSLNSPWVKTSQNVYLPCHAIG